MKMLRADRQKVLAASCQRLSLSSNHPPADTTRYFLTSRGARLAKHHLELLLFCLTFYFVLGYLFFSSFCRYVLQERRDLVSSHSGGLGPITSIGGSVGTSTFSSGHGRLTHTPSSADFQPPYFPPPYNLPQQQSDFHHAAHVNAVVAAAADPYSHLNSLAATPQQYHQLHPAAQAARGHNVLSRREEENLHLQSHMHSGLPSSVYGDGGMAASVSAAARRNAASEMVYASVRRPDVLMHGGHHISEQDLLNLHNAGALSAMDDGQVS